MTDTPKLLPATTQDAPKHLQKYISAFYSQKVAVMKENEFRAKCFDMIFSAFFNAGLKPVSDGEMQIIVSEFMNDVMSFYPNMRIEELREAIRMGSKGLLGEVYGVNPKAWNAWIKAYVSMEERKEAIMRSQVRKIEESFVDDDRAAEIIEKSIVDAFEYWKRTGKVIDVNNALFNYLEDRGKIKLTIQEKQELINRAQNQLHREAGIHVRLFGGDKVSEAKRLALEDYFKNLSEEK